MCGTLILASMPHLTMHNDSGAAAVTVQIPTKQQKPIMCSRRCWWLLLRLIYLCPCTQQASDKLSRCCRQRQCHLTETSSIHIVTGTPIAKIGPHTGGYSGMYVCDPREVNEIVDASGNKKDRYCLTSKYSSSCAYAVPQNCPHCDPIGVILSCQCNGCYLTPITPLCRLFSKTMCKRNMYCTAVLRRNVHVRFRFSQES